MQRKILGELACFTAVLVLAGCGGSGGVGTRPDTPTPLGPGGGDEPGMTGNPVPQPQARTPRQTVPGARAHRQNAEYRGNDENGKALNWALDAVNAAEAYARIEAKYGAGTKPGAGQRIAVIDTGIDIPRSGFHLYPATGHPELAEAFRDGRITDTQILGARKDPQRGSSFDWETSHGTAVSSLIIADKDGERRSWSFHGIAHGAKVDVYGIVLGSGSGTYQPAPIDGDLILGAARGLRVQLGYALENNPLVVNMSFGYQGIAEHYMAKRKDMETWLKPLIDRVKESDGTIFVTAAGNSHGSECASRRDAGCSSGTLDASSPHFDRALPLWDSTGEVGKRWVAAVATTQTGELAEFSNRCGLAARWCLAAPGADVVAAFTGENPHEFDLDPYRSYWTPDGTSFAAPLVSGGITVVKHYFGDTLSPEQVLERIYATADLTPDRLPEGGQCPAHLDTDGDRSTCELSSTHGQGIMNLETATRPVGSVSTDGQLASTAGAKAVAMSGVRTVGFDSLGYPFAVSPEQQIHAYAAPTASIPGFLPKRGGSEEAQWYGMQWQNTSRGDAATEEGSAGRWSFASAAQSDGTVKTAGVAYGSADGAWTVGAVTERNQIHGGPATGSYAGFLHHTAFVSAKKEWELGRVGGREAMLEATTTLARAGVQGEGALLESNGLYSSHGLHLDIEGERSRTRLSLEVPLRAQTGTARLNVPTGGTLHDGVRYEEVKGDLEPEATELKLSAQHEVGMAHGRMAIAAGLRTNPGHTDSQHDWHTGVRWQIRF